ncbi:MAG: ferritin family protein [Planctomycetes bacterium]|nr:ferritin family protein [Planctomycetota bacterium]
MSITFNANEVFEMAEEFERNGARFYRKAAGYFKDEGKCKLLEELALMEDGHLATFQEMREQLKAQEKETTTFDPDNEAGMYLRAMADGHVFDTSADPCDFLTGDETMTEIFKKALLCEKDSVVFYLGIKDMVSDTGGKDKVEAIIREEMGHISLLNKHLAEL